MSHEIKKKTVLITGSSGLLGSEIINQLLGEENFNVIGMTSKVEQLTEKYSEVNLKVVSNKDWVTKLNESNEQVDILINCAFPRSSKSEELALGIPFTEQLIKDSIDFGIQNIINISSQSVYTQKDKEDATEESNVQPESLYGMTKYACERVVALLCEEHNINYSNIRLGSLTGLNFDVRMTNRFVKMAIESEPITINGGDQLISYLEVRDAAEALIKMIEIDKCEWEKQYNLGNNNSFSLNKLIEVIKTTGREYGVHNIEVVYKEDNSNFNNSLTSDLFYQEFNWKPKYYVEEMVEELFEKYIK